MREVRRHVAVLWVGLLVAMVVAIVACGSNNETVDRAALASGCILDSDCVSPLRCAFKTCHEECATSVDCIKDYGENARCVVADRPFNVCQLPSEATCNYNTDCPQNERCASDRECRDECKGDVDCVNGQLCVTGVCAEPKELVDGGLPPPAEGGVLPNVGQTCVRPSDCVAPLTCLGGQCTYQCAEDRDCARTETCVNRTCTPRAGSCVPANCAALGKDCGVIVDGCGGTAMCGSNSGAPDCAVGQVCGGGGANLCGTSSCTPRTCGQLGLDCGIVSDGCSGVLNCGVCPSGKTCGGGGTANKCGCLPDNTAACAGKQCGPAPNNCQDTVDCGSCAAGTTCGLDTPNVCGCHKKTCADLGYQCGSAPDGCGGTVDCGTCTTAGQSCGGGGTPNQCAAGACTPKTCGQLGKNCGTVSNGCNAVLDCGTCNVPGQTCGGAGTLNVCGCVAKTCDQLNVQCGNVDNGCGTPLHCGTCVAPSTCGGGGSAGFCGCAPTTCAAQGKNCGIIADGCGGTLTCGACTGTQVCGAAGTTNVCATPGPMPSCTGNTPTCGPAGSDDCCRTEIVVGTDPMTPYYRRYLSTTPQTAKYPALVGNFKLDVYEITIGRFRAFAQASNTYAFQSSHPPAGVGANSNVATTLVGNESLGWQAAWNTELTTNYTQLTSELQQCDGGIWTAAPTGVENYPMRCITWYEAFAFCAWDGGRLPTWSEWEYAYHGGYEQRQWPWGSAAADCDHDSFNLCDWPVRAGLPANGDAKWGQRNMAGGLSEWIFDTWGMPQTPDCSASNCAYSQTGLGNPYRILEGLNWGDCTAPGCYETYTNSGFSREATSANGTAGDQRASWRGARCARND